MCLRRVTPVAPAAHPPAEVRVGSERARAIRQCVQTIPGRAKLKSGFVVFLTGLTLPPARGALAAGPRLLPSRHFLRDGKNPQPRISEWIPEWG